MKKKKAKPSNAFANAIEAAEGLTLVAGLGAVKKGEGKGRIAVKGASLLGSVNIDDDLRQTEPNANRWDYVLGVTMSGAATAAFVEVHSAETHGVSEVSDKLDRLLAFLNRDSQSKLRALPRTIHWVASGRVNIPKHLPQYKRLQTTLRSKGLLGPVTRLDLP